MQRALSFDSSPPLSIPLRFIVSTPAFVLLAGILLFWYGPTALISRWNSSALAITHLFTLGVLGNVMAGALMQILPVATGIHVISAKTTAYVVHVSLCLGSIILATAFIMFSPVLFGLALVLLAAGMWWFAVAVLFGMWVHRKQATKGSPTILMAVRLAVISLVLTVLLGLTLAGSIALELPLPRQLTDLHASWGTLGWVGILIIGISFQVIPMFQVTELYPKFITRWLALVIFIILGLTTANSLVNWSIKTEVSLLISSAAILAYLVYAAVTFDVLRQRKRPEPDTTTLFWLTSIASLAACFPVWLLHIANVADLSVTLGVLFIIGFAWSAVNGMLYKILPFLLWYNTQRKLTIALRSVPKVKHFMPDSYVRPQVYAHWIALSLLIMASIWPHWLTHLSAIALCVSALWLMLNMKQALQLYLHAKYAIKRELKEKESTNPAG